MKHNLTFLIMLFLHLSSYGQDTTVIGLERPLVKQLINQQFANLINPQSNNIIGNFASIDLKEAEVTFAGNVLFKNGSILGIKAKGGISDGLLPIFSNAEWNSKFGIDIQYNFLDFRKKSIQYYNDDYKKYSKQLEKIHQDYKTKTIEIEKENAKNEMMIDIVKTESEIKKKNKSIEKIDKLIATTTTLNKDSLSLQKTKIEIEMVKQISELDFKKEQLSKVPSRYAQEFELDDWRAKELKKVQSELSVYGFKLGWFSLGYEILNNSFRLFDPSEAFDNQITKSNYLSHSINLNYNYYQYTPAAYESYFISIGASVSLEDNLSSLKKTEINETRDYGPNPHDRTSISKYNAFQGSYKNDLLTFSLNADLYYFLFEDNKAAIHFYPEQRFANGIEPITNLGLGFLLTYKNQSDTKNIVNAEVYSSLFDIANNRKSEENLLSRSSYGIRFTFPINFNSNIK